MVERHTPALERLPGRAWLVAQIVAIAHERVDGAHGVPLGSREQHEGIIKVLGAIASDSAAVAVGALDFPVHAALRKATRAMALNNSRSRSPREIEGRPDRTS